MSAGGGSSSNQSTQSSNVWAPMVPYLEDLYGRGQNLVNDFQPNMDIGGQANAAWQNLLQPQGNPHLSSMAGQFQDQLGVMNQQTGGQAGLSGGYGGGRHGIAESQNAQNMGQQMGQFYGQQYQGDQQRSLGALGMGQSVLGMSPQQQQMQNLSQYAGLIGGPAMTSQGQSGGSSKNLTGGII